jgi:hypothetical protein
MHFKAIFVSQEKLAVGLRELAQILQMQAMPKM